jgi:hypothetical protein
MARNLFAVRRHIRVALTRAISEFFQGFQRPYKLANQGSCIKAGCVKANSRATAAVPRILATTPTLQRSAPGQVLAQG